MEAGLTEAGLLIFALLIAAFILAWRFLPAYILAVKRRWEEDRRRMRAADAVLSRPMGHEGWTSPTMFREGVDVPDFRMSHEDVTEVRIRLDDFMPVDQNGRPLTGVQLERLARRSRV